MTLSIEVRVGDKDGTPFSYVGISNEEFSEMLNQLFYHSYLCEGAPRCLPHDKMKDHHYWNDVRDRIFDELEEQDAGGNTKVGWRKVSYFKKDFVFDSVVLYCEEKGFSSEGDFLDFKPEQWEATAIRWASIAYNVVMARSKRPVMVR